MLIAYFSLLSKLKKMVMLKKMNIKKLCNNENKPLRFTRSSYELRFS